MKFEIVKVKKRKGFKIFVITGERAEQLINMTDLKNDQGLERIYYFLNKMGIQKALKREKAVDGDIIEIADKKFPYRD